MTLWVTFNCIFLLFKGKLEKNEGTVKPQGSETSKLTTLTKAIDTIQENSKSLESMGKHNLSRWNNTSQIYILKSLFSNI
jgi:hypothetical protein